MWVSQEHIGPLILKEIQMYILTSAELLFTLFYEIPCRYLHIPKINLLFLYLRPVWKIKICTFGQNICCHIASNYVGAHFFDISAKYMKGLHKNDIRFWESWRRKKKTWIKKNKNSRNHNRIIFGRMWRHNQKPTGNSCTLESCINVYSWINVTHDLKTGP